MMMEHWEGWVPPSWVKIWERDPQMLQRGGECMDCGVNTFKTDEYYMVRRPLWLEATYDEGGNGMLCISCLENRIGRKLKKEDFPMHVPINETYLRIHGKRHS